MNYNNDQSYTEHCQLLPINHYWPWGVGRKVPSDSVIVGTLRSIYYSSSVWTSHPNAAGIAVVLPRFGVPIIIRFATLSLSAMYHPSHLYYALLC